MKAGGTPSRIVVVSSDAYKFGRINKDDWNSEKSYNKYHAYSQSKLANILFARELSKLLEGTGVTVNSLHPGVIRTELSRHINPFIRKFILQPFLAYPFFQSPYEGAQTQIKLAVDTELANVSGKYFTYGKERRLFQKAQDDEISKWLWDKSLEITNFKYSDA